MDSSASVEIAVDWQLRMASLSLAEIQNDSELSQQGGQYPIRDSLQIGSRANGLSSF